jgi:tetratricopeptide (TPR) repeat protein
MSINFNYGDELGDIIESGIYQSLDEISIEEQDFYLLRLEEEDAQAFEAEIGLDNPLLEHEANEQAEQEYYESEYLKTLDVLKVGIEVFNYGVNLYNSGKTESKEMIDSFSTTIQLVLDYLIEEGILDHLPEEESNSLKLASDVLEILLGNKDKYFYAIYKSKLSLITLAANSYLVRGLLKAKDGKLQEGLKDLTEVISVIPHYINAYLHRGNIYLSLGNAESALQDFEKVLQYKPTDKLALAGKNKALILSEEIV